MEKHTRIMTRATSIRFSAALLALLFAVPVFAYADVRVGNANLRSVGTGNGSSASEILARISSGMRGGEASAPEESSAGNPIGNSASSNGSGANGGTNSGNGGNGGGAANGGAVNAGNAFSNTNTTNAINTTIIRISIR